MENIQNEMKKLFGGSCYGYCLAYLFIKGSKNIKTLTQAFMQGWIDGFIDYDGFVSNPLGFIHSMVGKVIFRDVEKVTINSMYDIPRKPTIFEMRQPNGKDSHFIVCHFDGEKVVLDFDPSGISNSWKLGKFISYRKYINKQ